MDAINLAFVVLLCAGLAFVWDRTPYRRTLVPAYALLAAFVLAMAALRRREPAPRVWPLVQLLYPVVFLFASFETFFMLFPYLNPARYDGWLVTIDVAIFGVHPTVWIQRWFHPTLTEILYICYLLYFPLPLVPLIYLYRKAQWQRLGRAMFIFMVCYYLGYAGYVLVPASGPRFEQQLKRLHTQPVHGLALSEPIRKLIDVLEPNKLDAFPSLHMGILLITLAVAFRASKRMFLAFVPLAAGIVVSLVYLRYHYVIDVIAGALLAGIAYPLGAALYRLCASRLSPHFTPPPSAPSPGSA